MADARNHNLADAALVYAEMGYRVFPCMPGTKLPLTPHGCRDATDDLDQVEAWWQHHPSANVAIATDGMLVVDVDGEHNPWLADEPERQLELAVAPCSLTANGGRQHVFRQPDGRDWRNTAGRIAPNVDTRANGGYVVVAPSVLEGGKAYRWQPGAGLDVGPNDLPEPPAWLIEQLDALENPASPPDPDTAGDIIPAGQRNATLARLAGTMRRVGMGEAEITAAVRTTNATRCQPPLSESEVDRIASSIARYEPDSVAKAVAEGHWDQMQAQVIEPPSVRELLERHPKLREPVIHGLLRRGETMNVISAPKMGKSWLVTDLAITVATGRPWLDHFPTEGGDVLILDNELHGETSANRIPKVAGARGIPADAFADRLYVQNLRGQLKDVFTLGTFFRGLKPGRFRVIILDAFYRFMPRDMDENDNGTMADLYNHIDRYADELGCCFVLIHHTTKGNQSGKSVTDVGAGAGSQSRATDTHLVLRPHEEEDAVVLDAAVRSWPPVQPRCLRWAFPTWEPADDLDPGQLRSDRPKRKTESDPRPQWNTATFVQAFASAQPRSRDQVIQAAREAGISGRQAERMLRDAEASGLLHRWYFGSNVPLGFATVPQTEDAGGGV